MASDLPVKIFQLKTPDPDVIQDMIRIYQEAYKNDNSIQLEFIVPELIERMAETIAIRVGQPECEFIVAKTESSDKIVGWLALAFQLEDHKHISEEHVLFTQYALLPDFVVKGRKEEIGTDEMKTLAHRVLRDFKEAREKQLPDKHCVISTLVVDPEYQNNGIASALLAKTISRSEVFQFPIWVQAPEGCQSLFSKHLFQKVGEYTLDINESAPKPDIKGKKKADFTLGKYVYKFMVRRGPLDQEIRAYKSSKVFRDEELSRQMDEDMFGSLIGKSKIAKRMWSTFARKEAEPGAVDLLVGDVETSPEANVTAGNDLSESSSTPLLDKRQKTKSNAEQEAKTKDGASGEGGYGTLAD